MNDARTVTRTRTEIAVEEIQEELFVCRNCEQAFDEDEMLTVGVDVDEDGDHIEERQFCHHCADSLLDYRNPDSVTEYVAERTKTWDAEESSKAALRLAAGACLCLGTLTGGLGLVWTASGNLANALVPATLATTETAAAAPMAELVVTMVPFIMILVVATSIISALRSGPRV